MVSLFVAGTALLCWPNNLAAVRLRAMEGRRRKRLRLPKPSAVSLMAAAVVTGWVVAGVGGAIAATMVAATARHQLRVRNRDRNALTAVDGLAEALRTFAAGLRSGAHPAAAAEAAAADAQPLAADAMRAIATAARLDGDMTRVLRVVQVPALADALSRVSSAWQLAQRHGLPLADVLDAVRRDLEQRARFSRQVLARMAGPKASAFVLSVLPALGIAFGEATGARPLHLLATTGLGQLLLLVGVTLLCAGVMWSGYLTSRVVLR